MQVDSQWRSVEACSITGVTRRQLDWWKRTGLITPTYQGRGRRSADYYSFADLVRLRAVIELRHAGASLQHVRDVVAKLQTLHSDPLRELTFVIFGDQAHVLTPEVETAIRVLDGQITLPKIALREVSDQIAAAIRQHPEMGRQVTIEGRSVA